MVFSVVCQDNRNLAASCRRLAPRARLALPSQVLTDFVNVKTAGGGVCIVIVSHAKKITVGYNTVLSTKFLG